MPSGVSWRSDTKRRGLVVAVAIDCAPGAFYFCSVVPPSETSDSATGPGSPLIEVEGLSRSYGNVQAVSGLSFSVGRGEVVGFLGPNGAGKSTTLRMIVGYLGPSAGSVTVGGYDVVEQPLKARSLTGYMAETAPLYPEMRVQEYLSFRARVKGVARASRKQAIDICLQKAEVGDVRGRLIGTLSRGYRQRVALADALLADPPLLILDEPTAGLDPNQIRSVRALIRQLGSDHTVLLSTHLLGEVESTCSRAVVIHQGHLVAEGPIEELGRRNSSEQARLLLFDPGQQALGILLSHRAVLGVAPEGGHSGVIPSIPPSATGEPAPERTHKHESDWPRAPVAPSGAFDDVLRLRITFEPAAPAARCLEEVVKSLSLAGVGVRGVHLLETSLEDVFQQLTSDEEEAR